MSTRPVTARSSRRNRDSLSERRRSGPSKASGSPNTVTASSNETPCLVRLTVAFRASHANTIQYILNPGLLQPVWASEPEAERGGTIGDPLGNPAGPTTDDERIGDEPDQVTVTNPRSSGWGAV